jgi:hypothetical protein
MGTTMDASLYGSITFQSVQDNVRIDLPACQGDPEDFTRYCKTAWHELLHTYPALWRHFDTATSAIVEIPEDAPDNAEAFPVTLDGRRIPIEAMVRALVDARSSLKAEQMARLKLDMAIYSSEQGIDIRNR